MKLKEMKHKGTRSYCKQEVPVVIIVLKKEEKALCESCLWKQADFVLPKT